MTCLARQANVPQHAAEDAAPYQDEEMPDFSGMSSAEHVDIPTVDAQDFTTTEETPSAPQTDPLESLAEAAVQADASPPQAEEPEQSDDSWEVPLATFRKNLPSSDSESESSEESSQQKEGVAPPVASPEPAYVPDELEDSEDDDSSEEEEPDLDGKNLSTPFETHSDELDSIQKCLCGQNNVGTKGVAPHVDNTSNILVSVPRDLLLQQLTHSLAQLTYHQSMVEMIQKALSDKKGGERGHEAEAGTSHPGHEAEAGTSHPLDARGREQGVNEEEAKNEGEAQGAKESSGSSDGGAAADTEETLDILL
ncbi:PREDICTED: uncharacterized protein LOC105963536 [Erythranthe guttata]|uniref:uncharacterized protein LOC105963536 n=1 Tax=Erythranthe guttata TaxID=4155 RepID=UPI00064E1008|nr:PREDICTED: uncharacterized protein LOC105963536 [Erythranthe guttata]|eukprot:XP_012843397.1 PREDICTED: uncharacterized protein LOC105963536 [Erythranthe guttata]